MSADISKLREIVGSHLAKWRATTPLEDFANVDDVYRTLMPELEEFFAAHTNAEIAKVLDRAKQRFHEPIEHDGSYISISVIDKTFDELIQAERALIEKRMM